MAAPKVQSRISVYGDHKSKNSVRDFCYGDLKRKFPVWDFCYGDLKSLTVMSMLPASVGATAAKVLVCFCIMLFVKFPPWEARKKSQLSIFNHKLS